MIAAGLLYLVFLAFASGMRRHGPALLGRWNRPLFATRFRPVGAALLAASLLAALSGRNWPLDLITWVALLPLMAGYLLLCLTYYPVCARWGAIVALALVLLGCR